MKVMKGHDNSVRVVAYSLDGTLIASGSDDGTVKIWNAATGLQVDEYTGHLGQVLVLHSQQMGLRVASVGGDHKVHVWSTDAAHRSVTVFEAPSEVDIAGIRRAKSAAVGSKRGSFRIWNVGNGFLH